MKKNIYLLIFDSYSDWEPSYISVEIARSEKYQLRTAGFTKDPVKSMGGLTVLPDTTIADPDLLNTDMLIIPGGEAWEEKKHREIIPLIKQLAQIGKSIAGICAGTVLLADAGLLDDIKHTSNADFYLKQVSSDYKGEAHYQTTPAVTDGNIITSGGVWPVDFGREIIKKLDLMGSEYTEKWYQLFKNGVWVD